MTLLPKTNGLVLPSDIDQQWSATGDTDLVVYKGPLAALMLARKPVRAEHAFAELVNERVQLGRQQMREHDGGEGNRAKEPCRLSR